MIEYFKKPVKCPVCHKKLNIIKIKVTEILEWGTDEDGKEKKVFEDNGQSSAAIFCYNCGAKIGYFDANREWGMSPDYSVIDC